MKHFTIEEINNGWLLSFSNDSGHHKYYFETWEEFVVLFESVFKSAKSSLICKQELKD